MKKYFIFVVAFAFLSLNAQNQVEQLRPATDKGSGITELPGTPPIPIDSDAPQNMQVKAPDISYIQKKYFDVAYGTVSPTQTLDIYVPNKGDGPFPVIINFHGGGFLIKSMTSKGDHELEVVNAGVNHGYAVVSVNYRLSGEARFPRAVNDAKAAVRFIRANAQKYNLDPNKIVSWGGSAGGNISSMLGTTGNVEDLNGDNTENLEYTSAVQATVDWFGPCNFLKYDEQFKAAGKVTPFGSVFESTSPETLYIGQALTKDVKFTERANPETYISTMDVKNAPFFIIQHGTDDLNIPTQQSIDFAKKLKSRLGENKVYLELIPGANHGDPAFSTAENFDKIFKLLNEHLK